MSDTEDAPDGPRVASDSVGEAQRAMQAAQLSRAEKVAAEIAEFEEMRKEERRAEAEDIKQLRERRERRRVERAEEEKVALERRQAEDARRKADEDERKRKKQEEEDKKNTEKRKRLKEAEDRLKKRGPNFIITKKTGEQVKVATADDAAKERAKHQKSKEQMEEEKRAILAQRIQKLEIDGFDVAKLLEKAKELHQFLFKLETDKYDLEQRFKRQQYDMIELAERTRQMSKGSKKRGVSSVQVDESFDRLADKYAGAPPKIQLCSKYERIEDRRTYGERRELFEKLAKLPPPPEINRIHPLKEPEPVQEGADE